MPWYPKAEKRPLTYNPGRLRRVMRSPKRINLHTAVSNGRSLFNFWNSSGARGVFSHFYVRQDGTVEQYQDTSFRAACDLDGNPDTISIESWDGGRMVPWTNAQMRALGQLVDWLMDTHPSIPRKLATDNRRFGTSSHGLSWHQLGVPYDRRPGYARYTKLQGGLYYTTARGKECPGPHRIRQVPQVLALAGKPPVKQPAPPAAHGGAVSLAAVVNAAHKDPNLPHGKTTNWAAVRPVEQALVKEKLLDSKWGSDGHYGTTTIAAYARWQQRIGYKGRDADGIPGRDSLTKLASKHGFTVIN